MGNFSAGLISAAKWLLSRKATVCWIVMMTAAAGMFELTTTGNDYLSTLSDLTSLSYWRTSSYSESIVTVVTAYYRIPSKHTPKEYTIWIQNFLPKIPCHLYVFTSRSLYSQLAPLRSQYHNRTRFIIKELEELDEYSKMDHWKQIKTTDTGNRFHTPELYLIWNQKWHFVDYAIRENVFQSDYFIWCDIGSFRSSKLAARLQGFPNPRTVREKLYGRNHSMTFLLLSPFIDETSQDNGDFIQRLRGANTLRDHIGGTIAAGHRSAWQIWIRRYYSMQEIFFKHGLNAGKDQNVMNAVVYRFLKDVHLVKPERYFNGTGDRWFFLQYYFS